MALLGNIIWFLMGGWLLFIIYTLAAILFFPVFVPIFRIARYSLFPFGKSIVSQDELNKYRESQKTLIPYFKSKNIDLNRNELKNILKELGFENEKKRGKSKIKELDNQNPTIDPRNYSYAIEII